MIAPFFFRVQQLRATTSSSSLLLLLVLFWAAIVSSNAFTTVFPYTNTRISSATTTSSSLRSSAVEDETQLQKEELDTPSAQQQKQQRRILGSQENLMLPRQYTPGKHVFPQMNHVCTAVLSSTPSFTYLQAAIDEAMAAHPLLRCRIEGDGEPDERIDLFQMVRKGEPNPTTFRSTGPGEFEAKDVLSVVEVPSETREDLDNSWKKTFEKDIDDGSWCNVDQGPLWKVEWHRFKENSSVKPCALVFSFNHAISDQSSANRLIDQIVANLAALEETRGSIPNPALQQPMPVSIEDSVLGLNKRWHDVEMKGVSAGTIKYVAGKAAEGFRSPVILPDSEKDGTSLLSSLSIIFGKAAGGEDEGSESRKSTLQYRTLSKDLTIALLEKCRANGVSISNALTAAMTLTATDFIDGGTKQEGKSRNYKVLQSLDMRRFGEQLDKGATVGCLAGSMDLMHGPFRDRCGEALRTKPTLEGLEMFWKLANDGKAQTQAFVDSQGPSHAMRVFDFAMTIADLNNLVYLTAQSKDSKGRAYSAGVTNCGVYERQEAFQREGESQRSLLKVRGSKKVALCV